MSDTTSIEYPYTNHLVHETSPYLLQHAHNPVNWYPWGEAALAKAKRENKLMIISIGYSACHWCHVMEHESFEDTATAKIMNEHFICIKVDREERPDIDQVYMNAVQLMTGSGGWPLNCFALPDGRPIYGGTYFQKKQWQNVLLNLADLYKTTPDKAIEYAEKLTAGIRQSDLVKLNTDAVEVQFNTLTQTVTNWKNYFDAVEGGPNHAPKFPIPNNYRFLLRYAVAAKDHDIKKQVELTLEKMAYGGIYDQLGGGFARYSTDSLWKVPHFEKMLYDNAQLVSLYCEAYQENKNPLYKQVVYETLEWIKREMTSDEGAFYSALDADSEGIEGKYYVWSKEELQNLLKDDFALFADYFNINEIGFWEEDHYILLRKKSDREIAAQYKMKEDELLQKIEELKSKVLKVREQRIHPGLDDKTLTSWNAMMVHGYTDAYTAFGEEEFLQAAIKNAQFIFQRQGRADGGLSHSYKKGISSINGFLEDYAFVIGACVSLYEATFDQQWLDRARKLTDYTIAHFYDEENSGMFYFTSNLDSALIARKMELQDNVIPASNSVMANNLFLLGNYFDDKRYLNIAQQMMHTMQPQVIKWGSSYSNWCMLLLNYTTPFYEVAIVGPEAMKQRKALGNYFLPDKMLIGSIAESSLPLLENKFVKEQTLIYVCVNKTCQLPVKKVEEAVRQMRKE
ncbi:MAG TPA: thioredoxin domain-containing protein [Chitinophagales bacterium]|nr:thioredoxin domain-containing protein [Chitinophagales bacterium]